MTKLIKYISSVALMMLFLYTFGTSQVMALEVVEVQPAETISYQEPLNVNSSLSATLSSYFFQGTHVGSLDGSGGVLFANGTIINVSRTAKDNGPIPVTLGDDMRVDGEIWRGTAKGTSDNMPLKISDTMVPTMDDINDLGDLARRWQDLYLSGMLQGNNATFSGILSSKDINITETLTGKDATFTGDVIFEGNVTFDNSQNSLSSTLLHTTFADGPVALNSGKINKISLDADYSLKRIDVYCRIPVLDNQVNQKLLVEIKDKDDNLLASAEVLENQQEGSWTGDVNIATGLYPLYVWISEGPGMSQAEDINITLQFQ